VKRLKRGLSLDSFAGQAYTVAVNEARLGGHEYLTPAHFLYAMLLFDFGRKLVRGAGGTVSKISAELNDYLEISGTGKMPEHPRESSDFVDFMELSVKHAMDAEKNEVGLDDTLLALLSLNNSFVMDVLYRHGASFEQADAFIDAELFINKDELADGEQAAKTVDYLAKFAIDMVQKAKDGEYDPLIGRDDVMADLMLLMARRTKNNPILVGDGGIGKTAILQGLAMHIASGDVPKVIKDANLYLLDMAHIVAGTKYRGDFEDRLIGVLEAANALDNAIIAIDEIHTVVGAGSTQSGALDASSILKPYLTNGNLRFIGTTTFEDYKKYFEKSPALVRRFQKVDIDESTADEAIRILHGIIVNFEKHHKVMYAPECIEAAVHLTQKYVHHMRLPDKAIDVLDYAGAYVSNKHSFDYQRVMVADVERAVAKMAKIPETEISADERISLVNLDKRLKQEVFGQDEAVEAVAKAICAARLGLNDPQKPVASLLFVGPTGVGKTEIARTLANVLNITLHRFDMSEYQEQHSVSRLIGSPPGYTGHNEGGLLTDAVRKNPSAVLLLDEIEKAHPSILNMLLQVMDYGKLTDTQGKQADFRNIILIMTSNAGAAALDRKIIGFEEKTDYTAITTQLNKIFTPEFRNRLNKIIQFNPITTEIAQKIAQKAVNKLLARIPDNKIKIGKSTIEQIAKDGFSTTYGARNIIRLVENELKDQIADSILNNKPFNPSIKPTSTKHKPAKNPEMA